MAKKRERLGNVRELRPGVYRVQVYRGRDSQGRPRYTSRTVHGSRHDAELAKITMWAKHHGPTGKKPPAPTDLTVGEVVARWIAANSGTWSPGTLSTTRSAVRKLAGLMAVELSALTRTDVEDVFVELRNAGSSDGYVKRLHGVLRSALEWAVDSDLVPVNVAAKVKLSAQRKPLRVPATETVNALLNWYRDNDPVHYPVMRLLAVTGARRSEVVGLRWSDIDDSVVTFRRVVCSDRSVADRLKVGEVKRVSVDAKTLALLEDARRDSEWVFSDGDGKPWRPDRLTHAHMRARRESGLDAGRLHDLRHWQASNMLGSGKFSVVEVAQRLGHKRPSTTLDIYASVIHPKDDEAAEVAASGLD